nr:hypothetical protein [Tanacetum cinerariifolium]
MHNNIMAARLKDHPPMRATGRYAQWQSRFLRYIDTRPNGEALKKCILQENKAHYESEKEAIHLPLIGIGDEIYSTVNSYKTAYKMWIAIERLQRDSQQITPPSESALEEDSAPEQAQKDNEIQKNMALIAKYFKKLYKPTNNNLRTSSNSRNKNVDTFIRYVKDNETGQFGNQRTVTVVGTKKTIGSHLADIDKEICEQELEAHCSYMAKIQEHYEQPESISNTCVVEKVDSNVIPDSPDMRDNDIQSDQNAEDERVTLANLIKNLKLDVDENKRIQKQLKKANTSLAHKLKECKSILVETSRTLRESNNIRDSCLIALQNKQTELETYKTLNNQKHSISLELALQQYQEQMKNDTVCKEKSSNVFLKEREQYFEKQDLKAQLQDKNIAISKLKKLIKKCKGKYVETKFDKPYVVRQPTAQRIPKPSVLGKPTPFSDSLERKSVSKTKSVPKTNMSEGLSKPVTTQNLPQTARQAGNPQNNINDKGHWDSGCSRHMTGNISYLSEYEPYDGGYVSFGHGGGKITSKGIIKMDFKLKDDTNVLLRTPRQHNMYSIDLNNIVPHKNLTCLVVNALDDEKFKNKEMNKFCTKKGIRRELSNARTPQQNGVAKRRNRTLIEAARTIPFECHVMILNTLDHLGKFDAKGDEDYFVGYSMSSKAFRVFNKRTKKVEENLHVDFLENKLNKKGSSPNWLFDIDTLTNSMNYVPVVVAGTSSTNISAHMETRNSDAPNGCNAEVSKSSGISNLTATSKVSSVDQVEPVVSLILEYVIPTVSSPVPTVCLDISPKSSSGPRLITKGVEADLSNMKTSIPVQGDGRTKFIATIHYKTNPDLLQFCLFSCFLSQEEPKKIFDALKDPSWVQAMQEELLQFKIQNVWILVDCLKGVRPIGIKWDLKNKKDKRSIIIRNKTRLVAQGYTQEEGIDYKEVFTPVARIEAIRLFLAYASFIGFIVYQMDVKSAFLYGTINEELCRESEALTHDKFQMSAMGELTFFLGLQVLQKKDGIFLSQDKYVGDVLEKFGYSDHLYAVKRIFRYLKGHLMLGLWYPKEFPFDLVAYSDSDYGGATQDRKSTNGGCQFLERRLISWQCKKQTIVSTSTTEAEYVAAASSCGQVLWIQN